MQDHEMTAWLGPAAEHLTGEQIARLHAESDRIDACYPDRDDAHKREDALFVVVRYLLGTTCAMEQRNRLALARQEYDRAMAAAQQYAVMAVRDKVMTRTEAAAQVGITRRTLWKALDDD